MCVRVIVGLYSSQYAENSSKCAKNSSQYEENSSQYAKYSSQCAVSITVSCRWSRFVLVGSIS